MDSIDGTDYKMVEGIFLCRFFVSISIEKCEEKDKIAKRIGYSKAELKERPER